MGMSGCDAFFGFFFPLFFLSFFFFWSLHITSLLSFLHTYLHISLFSRIYFFFFVRSLFNGMEWNLGPGCGLDGKQGGFYAQA